MRSRPSALLALGALVAVARAQAACGDELPQAGLTRIEHGGYTLAFAPRPAPIEVGRHFSVDVVVCALAAAPALALARVDAEMPAHRHGMNYRPTIRRVADNRYAVDGLMFHMPGRWRFVFEFGRERDAERLTHEVEIE